MNSQNSGESQNPFTRWVTHPHGIKAEREVGHGPRSTGQGKVRLIVPLSVTNVKDDGEVCSLFFPFQANKYLLAKVIQFSLALSVFFLNQYYSQYYSYFPSALSSSLQER